MASINIEIKEEQIIKTLEVAGEVFKSLLEYNEENLQELLASKSKNMPTLEEEISKRKPEWLENEILLSAVWAFDTSTDVESYLDQMNVLIKIEKLISKKETH